MILIRAQAFTLEEAQRNTVKCRYALHTWAYKNWSMGPTEASKSVCTTKIVGATPTTSQE